MPHLGHVIAVPIVDVTAGVLADVAIGVLTISSRSRPVSGPRHLADRVESDVHSDCNIDPGERANICVFFALELTQEGPQSCCLKDAAS